MNEPSGLEGSLRPALDRIIVFEIASITISWPIIDFFNSSLMLISLILSNSIIFSKGMPVHFETTVATSCSETIVFICSALVSFSVIFLSKFGIIWYEISPALSQSPFLLTISSSFFAFSKSTFLCCSSSINFLLNFQFLVSFSDNNWSSFNSSSTFSNLSWEDWSFSFFKTFLSIFNWIILLSVSSKASGFESISILFRLAASSIKSIALSGKNLSFIYLDDKCTDANRALSEIVIPWNNSYFSLSPLIIDILFSISGSFMYTCWNLLANALSFSIYFLYSSKVVAPTQCNSPLASAGLNILDASSEPSAPPAPTSEWSSSIKSTILSFFFSTSFSKDFNLSSKSPLNLAPAKILAKSKEKISLSFNFSGTSSWAILIAKPSKIAVLPTPGSPINTGLFLVLLDKTWITRRISSSLPITGSNKPLRALAVRLVANRLSVSKPDSAVSFIAFLPFLNLLISSCNLLKFTPSLSRSFCPGLLTQVNDSNNISWVITLSPFLIINCLATSINFVILLSILFSCWVFFNNDKLELNFFCKLLTSAPRLFRIFSIYFSDLSIIINKTWSEIKLTPVSRESSCANWNVTFDLSENCFNKLSISWTHFCVSIDIYMVTDY